jgi:hypothetical protein
MDQRLLKEVPTCLASIHGRPEKAGETKLKSWLQMTDLSKASKRRSILISSIYAMSLNSKVTWHPTITRNDPVNPKDVLPGIGHKRGSGMEDLRSGEGSGRFEAGLNR